MIIGICDDEKSFQLQLKNTLKMYYKSLDVLLLTVSSGEELLHELERTPMDLVFLDIEMPGMDGLETAKRLHCQQSDLPVILLTSHTELAMEGYEVQAFRFLAKPVNPKKLYEALQAFQQLLMSEHRIAILEDGSQKYLLCDRIQYIKAENVYLQIVMNEEKHLIRKKLKELAEELPKVNFVQVHRSYVLNLKYVVSFDGSHALLQDGTSIPVGRSNRDLFKQRMIQYMREK